ncbi:MAG TPA: hypothetical protein VFB63_03585 [Bryobacteraceae bacterium]|nr:hypothetical protein [Bryobacteraceae bacterium]
MPPQNDLVRITPDEFLVRIKQDLIPLNSQFSYFLAGTSFTDEDLKEYLNDPVSALPEAFSKLLPKVSLLLVPYLETGAARLKAESAPKNGNNGEAKPRTRERKAEHVARQNGSADPEGVQILFDRPADGRSIPWASLRLHGSALLLFGVEDVEVADYHYHLYHELARIATDHVDPEKLRDYNGMLREELINHVNGEVDDQSWTLKQALRRRQTNMKRETKGFLEYARESFIDTLTLYLHGICCDIDVETGPRQLPSRYLRKRLEMIEGLFPPPTGYAVFPEDIEAAEEAAEAAEAATALALKKSNADGSQ